MPTFFNNFQIDKQGIDQQINDNKVMRETEKARNDAYS